MLIKGAVVVNEGKTQALDVRIEKGKITSLQPDITQRGWRRSCDGSRKIFTSWIN